MSHLPAECLRQRRLYGGEWAATVRLRAVTDRGEVLLRRTWPQRLVVLATIAVIVAAVLSASTVRYVEEVFQEVNRVRIVDSGQYGRQLLRTETPPGEPVNFLLVGTDSALGIEEGDAVLNNRVIDPTGRALADAIMLLRLDPVSGSAWVLSIPRDLWAEIPGAQDNRITSALYIGGPELLVATVTEMFDVEINHYIQLDLAGFREVVDTLGGVPVWFNNPARDPASGLHVPTSGCHVLDGERSLQYVRSRRYTELIDNQWQITGGDDFARIERQQDFLVLALDRAIDRGARNLSTMVNLVEAGAASLTLDQDLTPAELIEIGQTFADFNPDNLQRHRLNVYTLWWPDGTYQGEAAYRDSNLGVLDVFRGVADSVRPSGVSLSVIGADEADRVDASTLLSSEGFDVVATSPATPLAETVVLHGPDQRNAAMTVARYLDPVPYVAEVSGLDGVVVALGEDYWAVNFLLQQPLADVEVAVAARGAPPATPPSGDLAGLPGVTGLDNGTTGSNSAESGSAVAGGGSSGASASTNVQGNADAEEEQVVIAGRPPEGETCG